MIEVSHMRYAGRQFDTFALEDRAGLRTIADSHFPQMLVVNLTGD